MTMRMRNERGSAMLRLVLVWCGVCVVPWWVGARRKVVAPLEAPWDGFHSSVEAAGRRL